MLGSLQISTGVVERCHRTVHVFVVRCSAASVVSCQSLSVTPS
jgi:hypothetical protein